MDEEDRKLIESLAQRRQPSAVLRQALAQRYGTPGAEMRQTPPPSNLRAALVGMLTPYMAPLAGHPGMSGDMASKMVNAFGAIVPPAGLVMGLDTARDHLAHGDPKGAASELAPMLLGVGAAPGRIPRPGDEMKALARQRAKMPNSETADLQQLYPNGVPRKLPPKEASQEPAQVFNNQTRAEETAALLRKELPPEWDPVIVPSQGGGTYLQLRRREVEGQEPRWTDFRARFSDHASNDTRNHISSDPASLNGPVDVLRAARYYTGVDRTAPPEIGWSSSNMKRRGQHAGRGVYRGTYENPLSAEERLRITEKYYALPGLVGAGAAGISYQDEMAKQLASQPSSAAY